MKKQTEIKRNINAEIISPSNEFLVNITENYRRKILTKKCFPFIYTNETTSYPHIDFIFYH